MNGMETFAIRLGHGLNWTHAGLRLPLAEMRRIEKHQQTLVNWLMPPDQSPLETTIATLVFSGSMREPAGGVCEMTESSGTVSLLAVVSV